MFSLVECSSCPSYVKIYKKTLASEDTFIYFFIYFIFEKFVVYCLAFGIKV